ncbi:MULTISPECIES: hypothetical protein [Xanthomonas]|uniref:hypothetical protein n=1 Tax=Xanthomonas TaxID=338 RepID=UPI000AB87D2F|nr:MULTISPECIES: hypothetical protein [Xanthomonas]MBB3850230.1 hypothetical protein [Xanthomonas arboricola]MBB5734480.1 hypothetical protein [Xanthomonas sp. CFBP 8152]
MLRTGAQIAVFRRFAAFAGRLQLRCAAILAALHTRACVIASVAVATGATQSGVQIA